MEGPNAASVAAQHLNSNRMKKNIPAISVISRHAVEFKSNSLHTDDGYMQ